VRSASVRYAVAATNRANRSTVTSCLPIQNGDTRVSRGAAPNAGSRAAPIRKLPPAMCTRSASSRSAGAPDDATLGTREPPPPPRYFICDKPFLILMLRPDQKKPYFAMWVENSELMVKFPDARAAKPGETPAAPSAPTAKRRGSTGQSNIDD